MSRSPPRPRGLGLVSLASFALAFVVRILWLRHVQSPLDTVYSDMAGYVNRAEMLLNHTMPGDKRLLAMFPPGTHCLVALEFLVFGREGRGAISVVHAVVGAIPAACVSALTFRLVPSRLAALLVGVSIAFWYPQVAFTGYFSSELWFTALICIQAWLAVRDWRRPYGLLAVGTASIAAIVVRSQFMLTWAIEMSARGLQLLWRRGLRRAFWPLAWLSLPIVIGLGITSTRFHRLTGYWGLVNESAGNRLWADTDICKIEATWHTPDGAVWQYWFNPPSKPPKKPSDAVSFEGYVVDPDILARITKERNRGVSVRQKVERKLWNVSLLVAGNLPWPESNYHDPIHLVGTGLDWDRYALGEAYQDILQRVVLPLAAFGLLLGRRNRLLLILAANVITAIVAAAFFFGEARYHIPYDPFLLLLAVTGGYELLRRGRRIVRRLGWRVRLALSRRPQPLAPEAKAA